DFVQHIRWIDAHSYTWDQGVNGENISLSTGFDNAFNYFFNPRPVAPNDSISFTGFIGSPINPTPINSNELNINGSKIKVYNVKNGFNIYYEGDKEISIGIYDVKGSIVKKMKIYKGNNFVEIRNKGIYIIKADSHTLRIIR
ncbi:MAG: hypothetical protein RMJ38_06230, partial [candidate division WOR-3 bacterium]|nr:hypothetical protein [candidate division WOR-3 bacterium]MDW8151020.1 hypothetical protein [candidate division WOR-3 bacterium]